MKKSLCVIGNGFVGGSLTTVMSERGFTVYAYDKAGKYASGAIRCIEYEEKHLAVVGNQKETYAANRYPNSITELVNFAEKQKNFSNIFFVCLPTPMMETGECDTSIVEGVLRELAQIPGERIAVVKSTVPPGSVEIWNRKFGELGLHVLHCPEFLTEANALDDMRNQSRIILGGPRPWINQVKQLFQTAFPDVPIIKTSSTTAEMVKMFTNVQLAVRVILSCELAQVCDKLDKSGLNIDYDKVLEYSKYDQRLGGTHMTVPGQDGIAGARGHCFPKDLNSLIFLAKMLDIKPTVMEAAWRKNLEVVPSEHRDWEKMEGRAVSKKNNS